MNDVRFSQPVRLRIPATGERLVATAWEAVECLRGQWPAAAHDGSYRAAYRACQDALDGWRRSADARRAFVRAAENAGLLAFAAVSSSDDRRAA